MKFLTGLCLVGTLFIALPQVRADQGASGIFTAESALPQEHQNDTKVAGMDDAVKQAVASLPTGQTGGAITSDPSVTRMADVATSNKIGTTSTGAGATTAPAPTGENQPLFSSNSGVQKTVKTSSTNLWFRMLGSLAIVLVLFGGSLYGFKRWPGSKKISNRARMIEIMSQHHLGPKKSLAVVRVAGETCLVGITDNNITILKNLSLLDEDIPKEAVKVKGGKPASQPEAETLGQKFQKTLAMKFAKGSEESPAYYTRSSGAGPAKSENTSTAETDTAGTPRPEMEDEFSMQGLREIVGQKLKTMKEL